MNLANLKSKASVFLKNPHVNALRGVPMPQFTGEAAQILISRKIEERRGALIARVGATEGRATEYFIRHRFALSSGCKPYNETLRLQLQSLSGYFPVDESSVDRLALLYMSAIADISVYGAWTSFDALLCPVQALRVRLFDLDPFFTRHRWTLALRGRRVCIVSPFVDTMRSQYLNREKLFSSPVLPEMDLHYIRAPMTQCDTDTSGQNWYENLARLNEMVLATRAEVVIIGAGAYGLPLGAGVAKQNMVSIVLGGSTQLLFGIKGSRWENDKQYRALFNENWVRPSVNEQPPGFQKCEIKGGAYW